MTPQDFISQIAPAAIDSMKQTGIPASFTIAEAALESGWGNSILALGGYNLFGVKADRTWTGETIDMRTREFLNNTWTMILARWRKYSGWAESIADHAAFLRSNPRYSDAFTASGGVEFAQRVAAAGYATDPVYAEKLKAIILAHGLDHFDEGSTA